MSKSSKPLVASAIAANRKKRGAPTASVVAQEARDRLSSIKGRSQIPTIWADFAPLLKIQTGGTVASFIPYDYQVTLVEAIAANQNIVVCKSRQMGISETICSYLLMRALTEPGFSAVVVSKTQDDASQLGQRIRDMALSLGSLCPKLTSDSKTKLFFAGLGKLYFLPATARAARGLPSVSVVVFDEAAFIDGVDGLYQAAVPTLSMLGDRGKIIFNSTPNGRSGLFWRLLVSGGETGDLMAAIREMATPGDLLRHHRIWQKKTWTKVLLHWRSHPIYGADPEWATKTRSDRQLTEAQWNQEYELNFDEARKNLFPEALLNNVPQGYWLPPQRTGVYLAGIDPSFGGDDYFVCRIWDVGRSPYQLVAQYRQNRKSADYNIAKVLELLEQYSPSCTSIETNGGGAIILQELIGKRPNLQIEAVRTTNESKIVHTDRLILMMERGQMAFPEGAIAEYATFIESIKGTQRTRGAEQGSHDDTVMADAIAFANIDLVNSGRSVVPAHRGIEQNSVGYLRNFF